MLFALRHAGEGRAATQATVMTLQADSDFLASKLALFDQRQRDVADRFLEAITKTDPWPP